MKTWFLFYSIVLVTPLFSQSDLEKKQLELKQLRTKEEVLLQSIEELKLKEIQGIIKSVGLPTSDIQLESTIHSAMAIGFNCQYKMAAWTFHVLTPDVSFGNVTRTNDFRPDNSIACPIAVEQDYFIKEEKSDGSIIYDGFGFDRGHLAPSADFRWSKQALSESYYYSNMTPQRKGFNRESWAEVETLLRRIVDNNPQNYLIITGPILTDTMKVIEKSINKLSIPDYHYKIIADLSSDSPKGMAFLMPNRKCELPASEYVVTIDSIQQLTGLDFFPTLSEKLQKAVEKTSDYSVWNAEVNMRDVQPINQQELGEGIYNTSHARLHIGENVSVIGKVVSTKYLEKSQATFLNLDKSFPNQFFTVTIWKDGRRNFSYKPESELDGKYIIVTGKIELDKNGTPIINVRHEEQIEIMEE
jgi:endonuclease G, mitochondrial